ncbi:MAG: Crp/Fnr family transcriptional regulator [Reichenbachiella sp.]|uniref:Crp/Fnr family transcriptional regulator n=1 Tax=Reichenbachiella sp. TaxID=2184521 RepID=UPI00326566AD
MDTENCWSFLHKALESYAPISNETWLKFQAIGQIKNYKIGELLLRAGQQAKHIHFICQGMARTYFTDHDGNHYNKNIFSEGHFPASMVSLLEEAPSYLTIEMLEDTTLINIDYKKYRQLINEREDLKNFYISYTEKRWVIAKEKNELAMATQHATQRYLTFLEQNPGIIDRVKQKHVAAHLGITPTQLSRIRKELKKSS